MNPTDDERLDDAVRSAIHPTGTDTLDRLVDHAVNGTASARRPRRRFAVAITVAAAALLVLTTTAVLRSATGERVTTQANSKTETVSLAPASHADEATLRKAAAVMNRRLKALGSPQTAHASNGVVRVSLPRNAPPSLVETLTDPGTLQIRPVLEAYPPTSGPGDAVVAITPPSDDEPDHDVILETNPATTPLKDQAKYRLGPSALDGTAIESATVDAHVDEPIPWSLNPVFRSGPDGIDRFNQLANSCYNLDPTCPTGQAAIVFDHHVLIAPKIQMAAFTRDQIQISGLDLDREQLASIALLLESGPLPVPFETHH
jgi:preprotein translocase subunit SecD